MGRASEKLADPAWRAPSGLLGELAAAVAAALSRQSVLALTPPPLALFSATA